MIDELLRRLSVPKSCRFSCKICLSLVCSSHRLCNTPRTDLVCTKLDFLPPTLLEGHLGRNFDTISTSARSAMHAQNKFKSKTNKMHILEGTALYKIAACHDTKFFRQLIVPTTPSSWSVNKKCTVFLGPHKNPSRVLLEGLAVLVDPLLEVLQDSHKLFASSVLSAPLFPRRNKSHSPSPRSYTFPLRTPSSDPRRKEAGSLVYPRAAAADTG